MAFLDKERIIAKFGAEYEASENTFTMGIDRRLAQHIASRFNGKVVLESCTGGGFTTIALARSARHVFTYEIDPKHQAMAIRNLEIARSSRNVTFINGDIMKPEIVDRSHNYDAAFLDPDWAITGEDHVFRFLDSNTRPPAGKLLKYVLEITPNIALILPPYMDVTELSDLPEHELQRLYLDGEHVLYCLYFGELIETYGESVHYA